MPTRIYSVITAVSRSDAKALEQILQNNQETIGGLAEELVAGIREEYGERRAEALKRAPKAADPKARTAAPKPAEPDKTLV